MPGVPDREQGEIKRNVDETQMTLFDATIKSERQNAMLRREREFVEIRDGMPAYEQTTLLPWLFP